MRTVCLTLWNDADATPAGDAAVYFKPETTRERHTVAGAHFAERGVTPEYFYGINGPKLGLRTDLTYEVDHPGSGYKIGPRTIGCALSHRSLWSALMLLSDDAVHVIEDDAVFPENWQARMNDALLAAPSDWDVIYTGSCCAGGKEQRRIGGDLFEVKYPLCTHGYIVRKKALPVLIKEYDKHGCYAPVDIHMAFHAFPLLRVFTVLPRILEQRDTDIPV